MPRFYALRTLAVGFRWFSADFWISLSWNFASIDSLMLNECQSSARYFCIKCHNPLQFQAFRLYSQTVASQYPE